jgi:hypothetical protein
MISCLLVWADIALRPALQGQIPYEDAEVAYCLTLCRGTFWVGGGDVPKTMALFRAWHRTLLSMRQQPAGSEGAKILREGGHFYFEDAAVALALRNYTLARTGRGLLVLSLGTVRVGDEVALLRGADLPLVVRREDAGGVRLVGAAYVHGIMFGEWWDEGRCQRMDFV